MFEHIPNRYIVSRKYPYNSLEELRAKGWDWLYYLAPPKELYNSTIAMKKQGLWNKKKFQSYYMPKYNKHLQSRKAQEQLSLLLSKLVAGEDVVIACWCTDRYECHTLCIANVYINLGGPTALLSNGRLDTFN